MYKNITPYVPINTVMKPTYMPNISCLLCSIAICNHMVIRRHCPPWCCTYSILPFFGSCSDPSHSTSMYGTEKAMDHMFVQTSTNLPTPSTSQLSSSFIYVFKRDNLLWWHGNFPACLLTCRFSLSPQQDVQRKCFIKILPTWRAAVTYWCITV